MKSSIVSACLFLAASVGFAGTHSAAYGVVFDHGVKNVTCARASLGLVQSYLKSQHGTLVGQVVIREIPRSTHYVVVNDAQGSQKFAVAVNVFDMAHEDGTCTATHIKFAGGEWLDLQRIAYSQPYPRN